MFSRNVTKRKDQPSTLFSIATKPMAELSPDQVLHREVVLRTRATDYNLFSSVLSQLPADISSNDFESLIDECNEVLVGKNDSLNQIRTVYPPQFPNYSNLILTKNYHSQFNRTEPLSSPSHNQDEQIFMQLLKNAYSNDLDMNSSQQGLMRCNIILKDISEIHSFEFEKELDYWKFIACIHQGIDGEFVSYKGRCKYITGRKSGSRDAVKDKEKEKKKFSITMSTFTGIGSNSINNSFNDSFELRENGVFCRLSSSNSPTRSDETVILFRDIIALALNLDHRLPLDYVMHVSVRLPAGYFRVVKSELKSLELQFATTNIADKRTIHAAEQFGNGTLPFETIDTHNTLIPLTEDILGMKPETDFSSPSTAFFASPSQQNKDISPLVRSSSQVKGIWEFEVYSDRINGKLLGKKTVQQNPFLETVNPKTFDADMRKVLLNMNNANPQMIASSISGTDSYNNAETSPFGQFSSFGRSRGKSMRVSSPPPLNKKDSECESPKPSPKRTTSINFSSGMNAATTINPNASYSGVVKSFLKCNDIKRYDLDIVQKQFHKALRVFIRSASGLAGGGGKKATPPSAYCTVYLVGKNQERLTANHTDVRTDTIKSVDPEWNKEILLQDQNLGIDEVQGVMVLVRDAASGFLKHKHLGQVMVPIDCFLPQDEAAFCLPLEPSYRMDGMLAEQSFLGNINLTTQLVNVESVDSTMNLDDIYHNAANEDMAGTTKRDEKRRPSTSGAPASTKQRQLFVRTKSVELVNAQLMCSLHRSSPSSTWWPIKILQISCMNKYQSTPSVNYHGFVLLNPHGVVLKVNFPTSESVVATAETQSLSLVADLLKKSKEYFDPHIILPYLQVESATVLSSSCLFLTLQLHNSNNNTTASRFTLEILCGPCKAQELSLFFSIRRRSVEVYHELTSLESKAPSLHPLPLPSRADSKRFTKSGFALPQSPSKQTDGGFAFFPDNLTSGEWVTSVKSIIRNLEAQHVQLATNESNANKAMERVYVRILFHLLRLFYIPNLLNVSSDITAAHYSNDSIRMRIHGLLDQATAEVKTLQSNGKDLDENEFLIARLSIFLDKTLVDFYQSLIFLTPRLFMNPPSSSFQENFFPEQIKPFLETFLTVVHLKFQDNLKDIASFLSIPINSYTSDLAVLKKRRWMKFLVEKNDYLQERFLTLLTLFHPSIYSIDPTFLLLPTQTILDFIHQMYQDHLKGLQSLIAALFREGSSVATSGQGKGVQSNYRWTVSLNSDGFQVSLIPENAQKILKMLVDYYDSLKQTPIIYSFVPSPAITSSSPYLKLCKKLLLMIYNAWLFVGHEYYSATHSHYLNLSLLMKKNIKPDYVVDLSLFVANLNDCSRIMSDYFPVLRDMTHKLLVAAPTSTLSASLENDIMKSLQEESYDIILEQLLLIITRLIFMPVVQSFLHFDELYFKVSATTLTSSNPPPSRFITTVCEQILNYLTKVRGWFSDMSLYLALIYLCEETIINRYLLFIRDAVAQTSNGSSTPLHQFTREEVLQFQSDFDYMKSVFEMISVDLPPLKAGQEKGELLITWSMEWTVPPLQYFEHLVNLLVRSIESFEFNSSLRFLLSLTEEKSGNISTSGFNQVISTFLEYFLLHIILPLHTESNDGEESRYQKENLFTYLMNFLDGNYEVIYRRTNEFCPINIQPRNHHTNFSNSIQQPFFPFEEEFPSNLKRDLLWRMFSPHNMHNSSNSTKSSVINQPSSRGNHETLLSLPDSLQNPFKGLFSTSNPSSKKVQVPLSATNHSIVLGENRNGRNSGKYSSPALIGSATVDNVRQTASEWIQKMTFMPKKGDSTVSSKKEYREKAVYDENTLFDVIGLEVFYDETIVSMEEAKGKSAHVNENINDKASNSNPTSASSKNNQPASSSLQTPVRTTRQDSSGKTSLFHLFTGNTGTGGASSKHNNHQASTTQKSKNPGISLMTENKEEPIYDTAVNRHTPHHAPPTPSVQQALHFFDDNETNTPATTVLSSNRGLKSLTLKISQVRLSGIHTSSIFSKANPYVYFLIPSLQVKVKTSLLHNASQGDFTDVMRISLPANSDVDNQTLTVEVYDKEKIRRKILLGWNSFRLAPYIVTEESQSVELPLVSPEGKSSSASANGKEFGKISFSLQFIVS